MSWARFDDGMLDHPKLIDAGGPGFALNAAAIIWCARNLTDGFIPKRQVPRLLDVSEFRVPLAKIVARLTDGPHGPLWVWDEARQGYLIHDYLEYNPSRADVEHDREQARIRQGRSRLSRRDTRVTAAVTDDVTHGGVTDAPDPVPVPLLHTHARASDSPDPERVVGLRRPIPSDFPLTETREQLFVAQRCADPPKCFRAFVTFYDGLRDDRDRGWHPNWDAKLASWCLNHDAFKPPCRAASRPHREAPDGPRYRDLSGI